MTTRYIDALDVTIADSFVVPSNKVESGHGEAKLYVGHRTSDAYREFFGPTGFQLRCRSTSILPFHIEIVRHSRIYGSSGNEWSRSYQLKRSNSLPKNRAT